MNALDHQLQRAAARVYGALVIVTWLVVSGAARAAERPTPELYTPPGIHEYCVVRANLAGGTQSARETAIIAQIARSYAETSRWADLYVIAGVDYIEFKFFHLVFPGGCREAASALESVRKHFQPCPADAAAPCAVGVLSLEQVPGTSLVATWEEDDDAPTPIMLFEKRIGRDRLVACTIRIP